jgi:N-methylhydantoinase A
MSRDYRVAIDTGGTFTDVVAIDAATGATFATKTPSTPADPTQSLLEGVRKVADVGAFTPDRIAAVVHGTTIATNAVLQGDFGRLGLLATEGFRHVLEIARQSVPDGYGNSYFWVKPPRIVPLERVREIRGRIAHDGRELRPLEEDDVVRAARDLGEEGADCIAVCFLHSYANAAHERQAAELLKELLPEAFVSLSCDVLAEYREYERAMTTLLDVFVKPYTRDYVVQAESALRQVVGDVPFLIMQSNGGLISAAEVARKPITTLVSGPAAGVLGATFVAERAGFRDLLTLDAGGTSTDVCLVEHLEPHITTESKIGGHPIKTPMLDVVTVAAGGGSIASIGPHKTLKVGPTSAGADPGPICYGRGGADPTVTDANLVLGRIPPSLLGGEVALDVEAARQGLGRVAAPLGLTVEEAAAGVLEIAAWNQTHGIRQVTIERGRDPRNYCLVAFGGSGPLLAGYIAELLEIETVLIPVNPGNTSAFGLQVSNVKRDFVRTLVRSEDEADIDELEVAWAELEREGHAVLSREGIEEDRIRLQRLADARYLGEGHEVKVSVSPGRLTEARLHELLAAFHDAHERTYGFAYRDDQPVELVNLRVQALGLLDPPRLPTSDGGDQRGWSAHSAQSRDVFFDGWGFVECPIVWRANLRLEDEIEGPAVVEEFGSTTVIFPGAIARVDSFENLVMTRPSP